MLFWKSSTLKGLNIVLLTPTAMTVSKKKKKKGLRHAHYIFIGITFIYIVGCTNGRESRVLLRRLEKCSWNQCHATQHSSSERFHPLQAFCICYLCFHCRQFHVCLYKSRAQCSPLLIWNKVHSIQKKKEKGEKLERGFFSMEPLITKHTQISHFKQSIEWQQGF